MKFIELTINEFDKVSNKFTGNSFYQNSKWAKLKEHTNWDSYYVGVKKGNKIVACSLILGKKVFLNKFLYYAPRGMLLDYNDLELLTYFVNEIKKFLIEKNGIIFKIDPLIEYKKHDKLGNYLLDDFSNQTIVDNLINLGFIHHGFTKGYTEEVQFRWSFCLDINKSKKAIFNNMNQRCRRCIKKSKKYPLEIVEVTNDNIKDFKDIMEHTANRQNHFDRDIEYYRKLQEELGDKSKLLIIYLDKKKFLKNFTQNKLFDKVSNEKNEKIPISAGVFIFDDSRANYVYGGTYKEYMSLMAQYKMQIEMIYLSQKKGIKLYDFGGISGEFDSESKNFGVYDFKRGFGGYVVEYIGEFDLILDKFGYNVYDASYEFYRNIKHLIATIIKRK